MCCALYDMRRAKCVCFVCFNYISGHWFWCVEAFEMGLVDFALVLHICFMIWLEARGQSWGYLGGLDGYLGLPRGNLLVLGAWIWYLDGAWRLRAWGFVTRAMHYVLCAMCYILCNIGNVCISHVLSMLCYVLYAMCCALYDMRRTKCVYFVCFNCISEHWLWYVETLEMGFVDFT